MNRIFTFPLTLILQAPAVAFANKGYHVLLEKPMAVTESDCVEIAKACENNGVYLAVCHVMRYFPPVVKIKEIIDSGVIGRQDIDRDMCNVSKSKYLGFCLYIQP